MPYMRVYALHACVCVCMPYMYALYGWPKQLKQAVEYRQKMKAWMEANKEKKQRKKTAAVIPDLALDSALPRRRTRRCTSLSVCVCLSLSLLSVSLSVSQSPARSLALEHSLRHERGMAGSLARALSTKTRTLNSQDSQCPQSQCPQFESLRPKPEPETRNPVPIRHTYKAYI